MKTYEVQFIDRLDNGVRIIYERTKCVGPTEQDAAYHYAQQFLDDIFDSKSHFLSQYDLEIGWFIEEI